MNQLIEDNLHVHLPAYQPLPVSVQDASLISKLVELLSVISVLTSPTTQYTYKSLTNVNTISICTH